MLKFRVSRLTITLCMCTFLIAGPFVVPVLGFSSGRTNPQQRNQIDIFASDEAEDLFNEIRHDVSDPRTGGMNTMEDVMRNVELVAEDLAEEAAKKCHAMRVAIDYDGLKNDFVECSKKIVSTVASSVATTTITLHLKQAEFESVQQTLLQEQELTPRQKEFMTNDLFRPLCTTMIPAMSECDDPKYTTLYKARDCKPDFEKDGEEIAKIALKDVCRNDGAWIFDFLEAKPAKCAPEFIAASRSDEYRQRLEYLRGLESDPTRPGKSRRLESQAEFCNITEVVGSVIADLLVNPCKESHPRPGEIIFETFKNTRDFWNAKCGAYALVAAWWPVWLLCLLTSIRLHVFS